MRWICSKPVRPILGATTALGVWSLLPAPVLADPCAYDGGNSTVTCTGNPSLPVVYSDINVTNFNSLSGPLNPAAGTSIATISNSGSTPGGINYSSPSYGFSTVNSSGLTMAVTGQNGGTPGGAGGSASDAGIIIVAPSVSISGSSVSAINVSTVGGIGGAGDIQPVTPNHDNITAGASGAGGNSGTASVDANIGSLAISGGANGISAVSQGGDGGSVGSNDSTIGINNVVGSLGGAGGAGGAVNAALSLANVVVTNGSATAVTASSFGGAGGDGGIAISSAGIGQEKATGGAGGVGGAGGAVAITGNMTVTGTTTPGFIGLLAQSIGGAGGAGGEVSGDNSSSGGAGGAGGAGGSVQVGTTGTAFQFSASLSGNQTRALVARSFGGAGGDGGITQNSFGQKGKGGAAAGGGDAGNVSVYLTGHAATSGASSDALVLQSIGGFDGSGLAAGYGAGEQSYGDAGIVTLVATLSGSTNGVGIATSGHMSDAILAQSIGGGGGKALEDLGLAALGGSNLAGGDGGAVSVTVSGQSILTTGDFSRGIYADSVGGGGGSGGANTGIATIGAAGGQGGKGGNVTVISSSGIDTLGNGSDALFAASRGGGGGSAVSATGSFSVGGQDGGAGGDGGSVSVTFSNRIATAGDDADAVTAQSIGGGGGDGANAVATGVVYVQAIGGAGGGAGNGGAVTVNQLSTAIGTITTVGDRSRGVVAQSAGGGGGTGGSAVAGSGLVASYSHAVGGSGGEGGDGGTVEVNLVVPITTLGHLSDAVFAQSAGGGGGSATSVINADVLGGINIQNNVGGSGGSGGSASAVTVTTVGALSTAGDHAAGIVAEAIGGGGGHSGIVVDNATLDAATIGVSIGGKGGAGGSVTGKVTVTAGGAITTTGDSSLGILAHSVGGGGGHGGTVITTAEAQLGTISVDLGGAGGSGGNGDEVEVTANGAISTKGASSTAISAVSAGGGGGSGGVVLNATAFTVGNVEVGIGGSGGAGGDAGDVTVTSIGAIQTAGHMSDGIYASSLGGFGGDAGILLGSDATANVVSAGNIVVELGGNGGAGGTAGDVSVTSSGSITTAGALSAGIYAQSLGGGGGRARGTMVANVADIGNVSVAVGGSGGQGGVAGDVAATTTDSNTKIATDGVFSHGIMAQSLGGAGGSGGFAAEISVNIATPQTSGVSGQVNVLVGGGGAPGGRSGKITVENASAIETGDFGSVGIFAQSIGGNGGDGGSVYAGNLSINTQASINVDVDVGGDGGFGAESDAVAVTNTGAITTKSFWSPAILAQSIGGNGGNGGSTYVVLTQIGQGTAENVQVSVGGGGSGGGDASTVTVLNKASILTEGGGSDGIVAQSIGGGGGRGGSAGYIGVDLTPPVKLPDSEVKFSVSVNVGKGGGGGTGGDADAVSVTNTGNITTTGTRSRGIFAQSIGGGGGDGGTASATAFAMSDVCNLGQSGDYICPTPEENDENKTKSFAINATVQIGGGGGTGGSGGAVTINNSGDITTSGQLSHGIYAQSVGGGGGNGGEGSLGIDAWTSNQIATTITDLPSNFLPSFSSIDVAVGGSGSSGGDGGAVSVTNSGTIEIQGPDASYVAKYTGLSGGVTDILPFLAGGSGIFAQSVGGGGGDGGAGSSSLTAIVTVGNGGGAGGKGGDVTVNNTGTIRNTSGFSGTGIFAQSVGGGGGVAGDVGLGFSDSWLDLNIGAGISIVADPGDGGDGGTVKVTSNGAILTTGVASDGIVAQSVGGSGGIAAMKSSNPKDTIYVGSGGAAGNGGDVTVSVGAPVTVTGAGSVGIVALSAGGTATGDQSGTVTVNVNANVTASGENGRGLLVSSDSYKNQNTGDVLINIAEGATVATGANGAETIGILAGGSNSTLANSGTITGGNASSYALRIDSANQFEIENQGTITGSILGTSVKEGGSEGNFLFNNYGLLNSGSEITLQGYAASFESYGTIAPGSTGVIAKTTLSSAFQIYLDPTSTYQPDFDPSQVVSGTVVASDMLSLVAGSTAEPGLLTLAGTVAPNVVLANPGNALRSGSAYILGSATAFDTSMLTIANSATVQYALSVSPTVKSGEDTLVLSFDIDTTPWSGTHSGPFSSLDLGRVNANHDSFGNYLDALLFQNAAPGATGFLSALAATALNAPDLGSLLDVYDGLIADEALAASDATFIAALAFADELQGCGRRESDGVDLTGEDGTCAWARVYNRYLDVSQNHAGPSYSEDAWGLSMGMQTRLSADTLLGIAGAWESGNLDLDGGGADITRYLGGVSLSKDFGAVVVSGSLSGGWYSSDLVRSLMVGGDTLAAKGDQDGYWAAAHLRLDRRFDFGPVFIEPAADLGITWLRQNAYDETGAGDFGLALSSLEQTTVSFNPFVTLGSAVKLGDMAGEFKLRAGAVALFGNDPSVDAAFLGAGAGGPTFAIENNQQNLFADLGAGIDLSLSNSLTLHGNVDSLLSNDETVFSGRLRLDYSF